VVGQLTGLKVVGQEIGVKLEVKVEVGLEVAAFGVKVGAGVDVPAVGE
jgi:hypothetical protein